MGSDGVQATSGHSSSFFVLLLNKHKITFVGTRTIFAGSSCNDIVINEGIG